MDIDKLAELLKGYSGADIASLVNAAAMSAIREHITNNRTYKIDLTKNEDRKVPLTISMKHFEDTLKKVRRNVTIQKANNLT
jgi:SpoVK/Ycf46/Vps4 family AAA+-type ATPase